MRTHREGNASSLPQAPTLILLCGLPGAGKTTLAKKLAVERNALRLTPDEWIPVLYGDALTQDQLDGARNPVEAMQWQVAEQALRLGVSVILDWGLWSRGEREDFRARAAALGANSELFFLDVPTDELLTRLTVRNANLPPGTFAVTREQLLLWATWLERPLTEELEPRWVGH